MLQPLALIASTEALRWDAAQRAFRGRLSDIDPTFYVFHQAHYRGFGLRSAKTGKVLPFYVERMHESRSRRRPPLAQPEGRPSAYTLRPTAMALEACPALAGVRILLTDDADLGPHRGRHGRAAALARRRADAARAAGDLVALQAYAMTAEVLARHAACPGVD